MMLWANSKTRKRGSYFAPLAATAVSAPALSRVATSSPAAAASLGAVAGLAGEMKERTEESSFASADDSSAISCHISGLACARAACRKGECLIS